MNVEIGTEAVQFPIWEFFFSNFRYSIFAVFENVNRKGSCAYIGKRKEL